MPALAWLTARSIAHRGLHDAQAGVIENTPSAFSAAIAANYAIETDVQLTADGEAMVHHDFALGRLTLGSRQLAAMSAAGLKEVPFKATTDRMITLGELCDLAAGRVTLLVEVKSRFDGAPGLVARLAQVLAGYKGPVAVQSFDPQVLIALREAAPQLVRGIVAERYYDDEEWHDLSAEQKRSLGLLLHAARSRPQFVAYRVADLPSFGPSVARRLFGLPLLTWTVRTADDRRRAQRMADQMIFEGFRP
jgi:glycerophosphoryl diester phosphodiesterase